MPNEVVIRADQVSAEFFEDFKTKLESRRQSALPLVAHSDFVWLLRLVKGQLDEKDLGPAGAAKQLATIKRAIGRYERR